MAPAAAPVAAGLTVWFGFRLAASLTEVVAWGAPEAEALWVPEAERDGVAEGDALEEADAEGDKETDDESEAVPLRVKLPDADGVEDRDASAPK